MINIMRRGILFFVFTAVSLPTLADNSNPERVDYKLTGSYYDTNTDQAGDINLRANTGNHTGWLGQYQNNSGFRQTRAGYEYKEDEDLLRITWSAQVASRGFVGGSATAEVGSDTFAILGIGRTNLHDYYNLNFDPNDSIVYGIGTRLLPRTNVSLFTVRDNRLHTGQVVTHLLWLVTPDAQQRWTVDLSTKHGRPNADEESVSGSALSLTYDFKDVFVRLARDRKVNFTADDQTRFSLGFRF